MAEFAMVARPYAKALFELAEQGGRTDACLQQLKQLAWLMQQDKVIAFVGQSELSAEEKAAELVQLLGISEMGQDGKELQNFIRVVANAKRLEILPYIYDQYQVLSLARDNVKQAVIYTAYDVAGEGQQAKIVHDLEEHFDARLQAEFVTDPDLIGGIRVVVGDQVLDLSVQGKLKKLYATMTD